MTMALAEEGASAAAGKAAAKRAAQSAAGAVAKDPAPKPPREPRQPRQPRNTTLGKGVGSERQAEKVVNANRSEPPDRNPSDYSGRAKRKVKRQNNASQHTIERWSGKGSGARKTLVTEFVICSIILALSPLSKKHGTDSVHQWLMRGMGISGLFLVLGLTATASDRAGRLAAATGAVITVALVVNDNDVFMALLAYITGNSNSGNIAPSEQTPGGGAGLAGGPA